MMAFASPMQSVYGPGIDSNASMQLDPIASIAPASRHTQAPASLTEQEKVARLRSAGLPVSALAEAMQVERKTVYSWINGGDMRIPNVQRVSQLYALLSGMDGLDARSLYRFWNTPVTGGTTLRGILTADTIDDTAAQKALAELRPAVLRAQEIEQKMARRGSENPVLDEAPEAGSNL